MGMTRVGGSYGNPYPATRISSLEAGTGAMRRLSDVIPFFGIFTGDFEKRLVQIYELFYSSNQLGESSLYLNHGYWDGATRYDDACQRLAEVLGEAADLRPGCTQLDCGCGFGDAALFWIQRFGPATIDCLNIVRSQAETALERVRAAGLEERVRLHVGSATRMPFADASFDRITALETAHHYNPREVFFREAYRVLRPGGRLATADILASAQPKRRLQRVCLSLHMPAANVYGPSGYAQRLENAGFTGVRVESIADMIYAPFIKFVCDRLRSSEFRVRMKPYLRWVTAASNVDWLLHKDIDYVIAVADKS
jgi:ubiquinone/menaquinone biosynthesis C-methylase UbiE